MKRTTTILLALLATTGALRAQWTQTNGPEGGNISAIASIGRTVVAAAWPNALYRFDPETDSWSRSGSMAAERLDVVRRSIIATTDRGLARSSDLGESWTEIGPVDGAMVEAVDEGIIYASHGPDLYRSTNSGIDWVGFGSGWRNTGTTQTDLVSLTAHGNLLVATGDQKQLGVIRSLDGGASWEIASSGLPEGSRVSIVKFIGDMLLAQVGDSNMLRSLGIYISADSGTSWREMNEGRLEGRRGYAGTFFFYRDGASIAASTSAGPIRLEGDRWVGTSIGIVSAVATDTDGRIYRGDFSGISRSDDDGQTWERIDRGLLSQHVSAITGSGNALVASSGNGIHRSTDRGLTWTRTGLTRVEQFEHIGSVLLAMGSRFTEQGLVRCVVGGAGWSDANIGITHPLPSISAIAATDELAFAAFHSHEPFDRAEFLFEGGLYRSADSGRTWSQVTSGLPKRNDTTLGILSVAAIGRSAVAITYDGLYNSTDGGLSWTPIGAAGLPAILSPRGFITSGGSYYLAAGTHVWRSDDIGATWTEVGGGAFPEMVYSIAKHDGTVAAIVGGDVGPQSVYRLVEDRWMKLGESVPEKAVGRALAVVDGTTYLATGTRSVLRLAEGSAGVEDEIMTPATTWAPVPLRNDATLRFTLTSPGATMIELYDINGRLALRHDAGELGSGSHELHLAVDALPAGVYGYTITCNGETTRGSVVIAR
jgi:hypothetical protein